MIYYSTNRPNKPNGTLIRVHLANGTQEEIVSDLVSLVAISPDEKQIVYIKSAVYWQLYIANIDGSGERVLAKRDQKNAWFESWGSNFSWSPDGRLIAICGGRIGEKGKRIRELILINAADGSEQIVPTRDWNYLHDVRWLPDQTGFIVGARETQAAPFQLWHISYPDGAARRITNDTNHYRDIALSPDSRLLLTNQNFPNMNIWLAPLDAPERARQITFGNAAEDGEFGIAFTPNGKIIYTSPRGGNVDLWQMNADGSEQKQLTKNAGEWNARPQVTSDGRYIVFVSTRSGTRQIWQMDANGGNPKQLTEVFLADYPNLSPDGEWIYFAMNESNKPFIAKIPFHDGEPVRVSKTPYSANAPLVLPDGKLIFHTIYEEGAAQPWRTALMSAETGEQLKSFDFFFGGYGNWGADSKSIIFFINGAAAHNLFQMSLDESQKKQLTNFESGHFKAFAVSPDRKQIAISRGHPSVEAVLLENFR
jgi:TolB protein